MLTAEYEQLAETSLPWYCPDCGTANHSSVLYDIPILDNIQHISYSSVSEDSVSPSTPSQSSHSFSNLSDTSLSSVGSPDAAPSPKISNTSKMNGKARRSLRTLVINFQSVRKKGKNIDVLVETTQPDIILGTETWLSDDIPSSYFFNQSLGFTVHRNDRESDPLGAVLIAVKNDLKLLNVEKSKELEMISGALKVTKTKKILLCSYFRPPNKTCVEYLARVKEKFGYQEQARECLYIIGGDFNIPDIDWKKSTVTNKFYPHIELARLT